MDLESGLKLKSLDIVGDHPFVEYNEGGLFCISLFSCSLTNIPHYPQRQASTHPVFSWHIHSLSPMVQEIEKDAEGNLSEHFEWTLCQDLKPSKLKQLTTGDTCLILTWLHRGFNIEDSPQWVSPRGFHRNTEPQLQFSASCQLLPIPPIPDYLCSPSLMESSSVERHRDTPNAVQVIILYFLLFSFI